MPFQEDLVQQMVEIVDLLIDNAQEMEKCGTIREEELERLQEKQEALVKKLVSLDAQMHAAPLRSQEKNTLLQEQLKAKFAEFEQAHRKFFNRIKKELRLIYFETVE